MGSLFLHSWNLKKLFPIDILEEPPYTSSFESFKSSNEQNLIKILFLFTKTLQLKKKIKIKIKKKKKNSIKVQTKNCSKVPEGKCHNNTNNKIAKNYIIVH